MIRVGSRVRHTDEEIDKTKGLMVVLEIKNGHAICTYGDYERYGQIDTYPINDLKLSE